MTRVVISGTISSIVIGMGGATIGAILFDTATVPFLFSSCAGFCLGAWGFYRDAVRKSQRAVDKFPRLMQLHLDLNFPHRHFDTWEKTRFRSATFHNSWVMQSMLIASWMTANRAIEVSVIVADLYYFLHIRKPLLQWTNQEPVENSAYMRPKRNEFCTLLSRPHKTSK